MYEVMQDFHHQHYDHYEPRSGISFGAPSSHGHGLPAAQGRRPELLAAQLGGLARAGAKQNKLHTCFCIYVYMYT